MVSITFQLRYIVPCITSCKHQKSPPLQKAKNQFRHSHSSASFMQTLSYLTKKKKKENKNCSWHQGYQSIIAPSLPPSPLFDQRDTPQRRWCHRKRIEKKSKSSAATQKPCCLPRLLESGFLRCGKIKPPKVPPNCQPERRAERSCKGCCLTVPSLLIS